MKCEHCKADIPEPTELPAFSLWIGDSFQGERLGFFCDDNCHDKWWNQ